MTTKIVTTDFTLERVPPPNLPFAPTQYDSRYQEALNNVLRLYFNRLDSFFAKLEANGGASSLVFPYGGFNQSAVTTLSSNISNVATTPISVGSTAGFPSSGYFLIGDEIVQYTSKTSTTFEGTITRGALGTTNLAHTAGADISEVQGTGSSTTIGTILINNTDFSNGIYTDSGLDKVYFDYPGIYDIQFSVQLLNFTNTEDNVTVWFYKNGSDFPKSASIQQVNSKHGGNPGATILTVNIFEEFVAGDYVSLKWASKTGNTVIATYPAGTSPVSPVSPGLILTVTFVSVPA